MSISLEKSVRSCSVNVGEANRIQTDRFFNPSNMVCIPWNGINNKGQEVSPDTFYTKSAGCDSAEDRVMVENSLRIGLDPLLPPLSHYPANKRYTLSDNYLKNLKF